jgi:hypothetical protein
MPPSVGCVDVGRGVVRVSGAGRRARGRALGVGDGERARGRRCQRAGMGRGRLGAVRAHGGRGRRVGRWARRRAARARCHILGGGRLRAGVAGDVGVGRAASRVRVGARSRTTLGTRRHSSRLDLMGPHSRHPGLHRCLHLLAGVGSQRLVLPALPASWLTVPTAPHGPVRHLA